MNKFDPNDRARSIRARKNGIADFQRSSRVPNPASHRRSKAKNRLLMGAAVTGISILAIVLIVLNILFGVLAVFILYWNITDIINVGVNFWNVFWIVFAALTLLGILRNTTSSNGS